MDDYTEGSNATASWRNADTAEAAAVEDSSRGTKAAEAEQRIVRAHRIAYWAHVHEVPHPPEQLQAEKALDDLLARTADREPNHRERGLERRYRSQIAAGRAEMARRYDEAMTAEASADAVRQERAADVLGRLASIPDL